MGRRFYNFLTRGEPQKKPIRFYNHITATVDETIKNITSSANERRALEIIKSMTHGGIGSKIIKHSDFVEHGMKHKNRRNEAVLRLIDKGMIYRTPEDMEMFNGAFQLYRYSIIIGGCVRFLKGKNK